MAGETLSNPQNNVPNVSDWDGISDEVRTENLARAHTESDEKARLDSEERDRLDSEERARLDSEERDRLDSEEKAREEHEANARQSEEQRSRQEQEQEQGQGQEQSANQETFTKEQYDQRINEIEELAKEKIGVIDIPYKEFECDIDKDSIDRINDLTGQLKEVQLKLAELYAQSRRLIGFKDSADFAKAKDRYSEILAELERLKAENSYELEKDQANKALRAKHDKLNAEIYTGIKEFILANPNKDGDDNNPKTPPKTPEEIAAEKKRLIEEATEKLTAEYERMNGELKTKINSEVLEDFLKQRSELEDGTIDRLDNGTLCRRIVNKVLNNKKFKKALVIGAAVGLAATGVGLATGLAVGAVGFAGFSAAGAVKGGISGAVMSRQNSKNSAVRGFVNEAEIKQQVEGLDFTNLDPDTEHVANWLLDQYESAKDTDFKNNWERTAIASGLGAAAGAIVGGIEVNANTDPNAADNLSDLEADKSDLERQINLRNSLSPSGNDPQVTAANLGEIDIPEGHGAYDTFTQLGGDPADFDKFQEIMHSLDAKYGMVPGSNGETAGLDGTVGQYAHTYPGPIDTWPEAARNYITEVANEAARQGLIPSSDTGTTINNISNSVDISNLESRLADVNTQIDNANAVIAANNRANTIATAINGLNQLVWPFTSGGAAGVVAGAVTDRVAANTSTNTPTQSANQSPAQNPNQAPDQNTKQYREVVVEKLGSLINNEGVDILSDTSAYDPIYDAKFLIWWKSLTPDAKKAVVDFESAEKASGGDNGTKHGRAFRTFLQLIGVNL